MTFWTCGPFKQAQDGLEIMVFKAQQMKVWMEALEESKRIEEILEKGTPDEKLLAAMLKLDIDKKLEALIGVPDGYETKNDEISREAILESIASLTRN